MSRRAGLLVAAAALFLGACAGAPPAAPPATGARAPHPGDAAALPPPGAAPFGMLAARFTDRALEQERAGELRQALDSWKVVAALRTEAAEPRLRVEDLSARVKVAAERHFRDGLARLQEGNADAARRELLLALAADPDHAAALEALKNRIEPDAVAYTVAAGESFEGIARKHYGDLAKAPIVARVNSLDPAGKPAPGTVLTLPNLAPAAAKTAGKRAPEAAADASDSGYDTEPAALGTDGPPAADPAAPAPPAAPAAPATPVEAAKTPDPAEAQLARAQELFQAKKFEDAGNAADRIAGSPAVAARARELSGNAWFAAGDAALKEERFADAAAAYRKAEPTRKDVAAALGAVERRRKEKAEELYNAGVHFFINQKLDEAIRSWEQTLALNPEHAKAPKDIEKARGLQQKLKDLR
jgi:tetratricopeptide (TPR) repeat protein